MSSLKEFISNTHPLYNRYRTDWKLAYNAYIGGPEWRKGRYLKAYQIDFETPSQTINTYDIGDDGLVNGKYKTSIINASSSQNAESGIGQEGTFYSEKLNNTPLFPYVRLYVSEYNSILFKNAPHRDLYEDDTLAEGIIGEFTKDVDGEGNSINEFWSQVDILSSVFGVVWVSCIKPKDGQYPLFSIHTPLDVINWEYGYTADGRQELKRIAIILEDNDEVSLFRLYTKETIETIWIPKTTGFSLDIEDIIEDEGMFRYIQPNELGYIPVRPIYQSMKVYNGIGHTPMFDIAQIQRSVYGYMAEVYSAITYGAHPVNIVDEATVAKNNGNIGAEPGTTVVVSNDGIPGQTNYVFDFKAPPLESITEIRELVDQMIEKMNTVAMIRSEDLIKASRSGAQIEQYDTKLEAFIRKKATSLENAEYQMWMIWHDWMNMIPADCFSISYNKMYGNKGIENELKVISGFFDLMDRYEARYAPTTTTTPAYNEMTEQDIAMTLVNPETGEQRTLATQAEYDALKAQGWDQAEVGEVYPETPEMEQEEELEELKEALKKKFKQLLMGSFTENSQ
jgi:hypothetical protein